MATTAAADRRDPTAPRRPFRASVDIADVVEQEIWQGDARDLSVGGMSVQSALVPEIGEELACRFELEDGRKVESRAEVIWAREGGARDGAFGVRFTALDASTREALRKATPAAATTPAAAPSGGLIAENSKVRIVIPGMDAPLRARVRTRVQDALIVGSDLTFLKLGEKVTVDGGADTLGGTITAVDIEVDGRSGVPRLILTIDGEGALAPRREAAPAVPKAVAPVAEAKAPRDEKADAPRDTSVDARPAEKVAAKATAEKVAEKAAEKPARPAAQATRVLSTSDGEDLPDDDEADTRTWAQRALQAAKDNTARLAAAAGPAARNAATAVSGAVVAVRAKIQGAAAKDDVAEAKPAGTGRFTLRPQHATASDPGSAPKRNRRAVVLAGAGGLAALGIVAYAVAGGPRETAPRPQVTVAPETLGTEAPNGADPLAVPAGEATTPATEPVPGATTAAPQAEPRMINGDGTAMPPDLRSAANSPSANVTGATAQVTGRPVRAAVATAPAAARAPAAGRLVMGSPAVRAGTLVRLRMDGAITTLGGAGARGADIVISIPGRRSLDLGAPIARLDSRILTSRVMNRVAGAELTLHFRGAAPPFSARARGNVLELVLAATPGVRATARR